MVICKRDGRPGDSRIISLTAGIALVSATLALNQARPSLLLNTTPSEPPGLYQRTRLMPEPGRLVAFPAPVAAFPYADRRLRFLRSVPLLKAVAAGPGDQVCTLSGRLVIDGRDMAPIAEKDREGRTLPRWMACRRLRSDELFVFSARVPNSFDSRYFGPVPRASVIGVFRRIAGPMSSRP